VLVTFPEILTERLDGSGPDLAMPMNDFAAKHSIVALTKSVHPVAHGLGYGYLSVVPAASAMKLLRRLLSRTSPFFGFPFAFASIPQAMAAALHYYDRRHPRHPE
jgi:hypothetical protein